MPTWWIVLSIVVYLGIGLGLISWAKPDGEEMDTIDYFVSILWPLALIGGFVSWMMDCIFGKA